MENRVALCRCADKTDNSSDEYRIIPREGKAEILVANNKRLRRKEVDDE